MFITFWLRYFQWYFPWYATWTTSLFVFQELTVQSRQSLQMQIFEKTSDYENQWENNRTMMTISTSLLKQSRLWLTKRLHRAVIIDPELQQVQTLQQTKYIGAKIHVQKYMYKKCWSMQRQLKNSHIEIESSKQSKPRRYEPLSIRWQTNQTSPL